MTQQFAATVELIRGSLDYIDGIAEQTAISYSIVN